MPEPTSCISGVGYFNVSTFFQRRNQNLMIYQVSKLGPHGNDKALLIDGAPSTDTTRDVHITSDDVPIDANTQRMGSSSRVVRSL
eukprot:2041649-Amphidinium_carterae.1